MLKDYYTPCDDADSPMICLRWQGFNTNNVELCNAGWVSKCLYNRFTKKYLVRFYHPKLYMTFALKLDSLADLDGRAFDIEFMSTGGRMKRRPPNRKIETLTSEDVPVLLEVITGLQEVIRKKQIQGMELPSGDIVDFNEYLKAYTK